MKRIYLLPEEMWYTANDPHLPESGSLHCCTRSPSVYRCPELERVSRRDKHQNAFNYTRNLFARKFDVDYFISAGLSEGWHLGMLKPSAVYNTTRMMMIDEAWDCYAAWPLEKAWVRVGMIPCTTFSIAAWDSTTGPTSPGGHGIP
jgi:hypothetical protein